jgi:ketosteroid isomerase-like protein
MSQENVGIVREVWNAYSRGDLDRIGELSDPYVVMITVEDGPMYGFAAVRKNYERWNEAWGEHETTVEEVIGNRDRVFVMARFRGRGRTSGVEVESRLYEVYTMRNGMILRVDEFSDRAEALEAAGLRE